MTSATPLHPSDDPSAVDPDERGGALPVGEMTFAEYLQRLREPEAEYEGADIARVN